MCADIGLLRQEVCAGMCFKLALNGLLLLPSPDFFLFTEAIFNEISD